MTCITIDSGSNYDDCRCIKRIGYEVVGIQSSKTPEQIYDDIENDDRQYYIKENGTQTDLIPATHGSTKYVRTEPNDTTDDNLLEQPSC